jgi:hypothetical protein
MTTATAKPAVPRDARHAAAQGFSFRNGSATFEDDFINASTMIREGEMELEDGNGGNIVIPFKAKCTFGKPRLAK